MQNRVKLLSAVYLLYLVLNILSGELRGVWSDVVFALSFALPTLLALGYIKKEDSDDIRAYLGLDSEGVKTTLLFLAPTIALTGSISYTTGLVLKFFFGELKAPSVPDDFLLAILVSALLPALIEEIMFRYLPMRVLSGAPRSRIIMLSSLFFAFAHASLYQIPYALVAGFLFMLLDLMAGSVLPSFILHFFNNVFSLVLIFCGENLVAKICLNVIGGLLFALSFALFLRERKRLIGKINQIFTPVKREESWLFSLLFVIPAFVVACGEFFA
ncbi:MAG: CPBP family intramembrane metalloprotease [Clostridia bacterium]|nr:CPBP family intramembrane metalloprotease [Clostridia bacterium]